MKISIITVCHNSEVTIRDTIESVFAQIYSNIEYIIIDGGSEDGTLSIISEYQDKIACLISEPDQGLYDAMNKGISFATGDFIGILNSDDIFYDNFCIEKLVSFIGSNQNIDAVYADLIYVERNNLNKKTRTFRLKKNSLWKYRFGFMIPHPTFYVRSDFFKKNGMYKTDYKVAADFELILRFMLHGIKIARLPIIMIKMRRNGVSDKGLLSKIQQNIEIVKACRENGVYTNLFFVGMKIPFKVAGYLF